MGDQPTAQRGSDRSRALTVVGVFLTVVVAFTSQEYAAVRWGGGPITWWSILFVQALTWGVWAALTPIAIAPLCRRFRIANPRIMSNILVHAAAAIVLSGFAALAAATLSAVYYFGGSPLAIRDMFRDRVYTSLAANILAYTAIAAGLHAFFLVREAERRALDAAHLEARAARAELAALYSQLQPHFLFNTFNAMVELVQSDPPRATRMIRGLSDLLRRSLAGSDDPATPLRDELDLLHRYVALQQVRFEGLVFELHADEAALDARVPRMILQPLVENAIHFTVGVRGRGHVTVTAARRGECVELLVIDDGPGFASAMPPGRQGRGLAVTRARLEGCFGAASSLTTDNAADGGARVRVTLPFVTAPLAPPS